MGLLATKLQLSKLAQTLVQDYIFLLFRSQEQTILEKELETSIAIQAGNESLVIPVRTRVEHNI